jgi:3',5'-cyclic AMP phosphodiesterase CpdA
MGVAERGSVVLAHLTDAHVAPMGKRNAALKDQSVPIFRDLIDQIRERRADLTLFGGDNIDNHGHGEEDLEAFVRMSSALDRWSCIVGNHEAEAPLPGQISKEMFASAVAGHGIEPGRLHFSESVGDVRVIGIDTTLVGSSGGYVSQAMMRYLAGELNKADEEHIVVLGHHLLYRAWEPHSLQSWDKDYLVGNRDALIALLASHPRVRAYLCGHHHASRIQRIAARGSSGGFYHILTASPVSFPHAARLLTFEHNGIRVETLRPRIAGVIEEGRAAILTGRKAQRYGALGARRSFLQYVAGRTADNDVMLPYAHAPVSVRPQQLSSERRVAAAEPTTSASA